MTDDKRRVKLTVVLCCLVILIYSGIKIYHNQTTTNTLNENISKIISKYGDIDYGVSSTLTETTITEGGSYDLTGEYGSITIDTTDNVRLNLDNVTIKSTDGPAINVISADTVSIVIVGKNTISVTTDEELDGAIYAESNLVFSGTGSIKITSNYDGIVSKKDLIIKSGTYDISVDNTAIKGNNSIVITGGTFDIEAAGDGIHSNGDIVIETGSYIIDSKDDAIHADGMIEIDNVALTISAAEGIEATYVKINGGAITISATDDGINAGHKSDKYPITIEINGGAISIDMGTGDTDGIDSNGNLYINGGIININANSPFDYDGEAKYTGGTIIVNGETTNTITNHMVGGMPQGNDPRGMRR